VGLCIFIKGGITGRVLKILCIPSIVPGIANLS
jgi:hypothetical protein